MPRKTVYLNEKDEAVWNEVQRMLPFYQNKSLSTFLIENVREYLKEEKATQANNTSIKDSSQWSAGPILPKKKSRKSSPFGKRIGVLFWTRTRLSPKLQLLPYALGVAMTKSLIAQFELLNEYTGPYGIETPGQAIERCIAIIRHHEAP
jgi:hypothetical protein